MRLLPAGTNAQYDGARASAWFLMLAGVFNVIPECIHYFLPDGGAGVIAGIDLSTRGQTIIAVFAWMGAMQIAHGAAQFLIGWRYRPLVPFFLVLLIVERALMAADGWFLKGAASSNHPPEHYASAAVVPIALVFLWLSLRPGRKG